MRNKHFSYEIIHTQIYVLQTLEPRTFLFQEKDFDQLTSWEGHGTFLHHSGLWYVLQSTECNLPGILPIIGDPNLFSVFCSGFWTTQRSTGWCRARPENSAVWSSTRTQSAWTYRAPRLDSPHQAKFTKPSFFLYVSYQYVFEFSTGRNSPNNFLSHTFSYM